MHLIGTAHPDSSKADAFVAVDLASARAAAEAAERASIAHFVYVCVAQPAPVIKAYVATRVAAKNQMVDALAHTVENPLPPREVRIVDVPAIKQARNHRSTAASNLA